MNGWFDKCTMKIWILYFGTERITTPFRLHNYPELLQVTVSLCIHTYIHTLQVYECVQACVCVCAFVCKWKYLCEYFWYLVTVREEIANLLIRSGRQMGSLPVCTRCTIKHNKPLQQVFLSFFQVWSHFLYFNKREQEVTDLFVTKKQNKKNRNLIGERNTKKSVKNFYTHTHANDIIHTSNIQSIITHWEVNNLVECGRETG